MTKMILLLSFFGLSAFADPNPVRCTVRNQIEFGATTVSIKALNSNSLRKCLTIQNKLGASTAYIKFGSAHTGTEGIALAAGVIWQPIVVPVGPVYIESSAGVVTTSVLEGD